MQDKKEEIKTFNNELRSLINRYSKESGSNTPDYLLANYLIGCLDVFDSTVRLRDQANSLIRFEAISMADKLMAPNQELQGDNNDVIEVTRKLYFEINPNTKMDVPSYAFEQTERAKKRWLAAGSKVSLYDFCMSEIHSK
jgi:hypothetical protein